jgi:tripeptidyl-peptidase I
VSDPDHLRYGQHLSAVDVQDLIRPTSDTLDLVHEWLEDNGIEDFDYSPAKDWIKVTLPVKAAENLLGAKYSIFEHEDGTRIVRTTEWSLPQHLHEHIDAVQPTTSFLRTVAQKSESLNLKPWTPPNYAPPTNLTIQKVCNISSVSPECFSTLYSTKGYRVKAAGRNKIAFTNYLGEIPIRPDAALFAKKYKPEAVRGAYSFPQISIKGGPTQDGPLNASEIAAGISREANLDVQAILGISYPTPITAYSTGGSPPYLPDLNTPTNTNEPYLDWLEYITSQYSVPQVISTSYADDEQTVPPAYAARVCRQFAQLGARGVSLLFGSGDRGVGVNGTCLSNDGKNTTQFVPCFPCSCPYVTTVGATHQFEPEVVAFRPAFITASGAHADIYSSGGGFSNYFPQPRYQKDVVDAYVKNLGGKYDGYYNKSGRAYPDISAQGQYFAYFYNLTEGTISGTSASTPLTSGILALVNDALLAEGRRPLGFLNPWLYKKGFKGFTDILSGSAVGCGGDGFPATKGWDPVSGFGTPVSSNLFSNTY